MSDTQSANSAWALYDAAWSSDAAPGQCKNRAPAESHLHDRRGGADRGQKWIPWEDCTRQSDEAINSHRQGHLRIDVCRIGAQRRGARRDQSDPLAPPGNAHDVASRCRRSSPPTSDPAAEFIKKENRRRPKARPGFAAALGSASRARAKRLERTNEPPFEMQIQCARDRQIGKGEKAEREHVRRSPWTTARWPNPQHWPPPACELAMNTQSTSREDQMPFKYSTRSFLFASLRLRLKCAS